MDGAHAGGDPGESALYLEPQGVDHETRPWDKTSRPAGRKTTRHWNSREQWIISDRLAHPPLQSEEEFALAQQITALPAPDDANTDRYPLTGLLICGLCGLCGRRAEGHWAPRPRPLPLPARLHRRQRRPTRPSQNAVCPPGPDPRAGRHQYAHFAGIDPVNLDGTTLGAQLRARAITIVCTPVSITLDTGQQDATDEPEPMTTSKKRT